MGEADYSKPGGHILDFPIVVGEANYSKLGRRILDGEADYSKPGGHILDALLDICDMPAGAWAGGRRHKMIQIFPFIRSFDLFVVVPLACMSQTIC